MMKWWVIHIRQYWAIWHYPLWIPNLRIQSINRSLCSWIGVMFPLIIFRVIFKWLVNPMSLILNRRGIKIMQIRAIKRHRFRMLSHNSLEQSLNKQQNNIKSTFLNPNLASRNRNTPSTTINAKTPFKNSAKSNPSFFGMSDNVNAKDPISS